jgi:surface polysaccharide O-acyltransferase-like enzyme
LQKSQIIWIDAIRAIACFMVVFLHSAGPVLYKYNEVGLSNWFVANVYDSIVRVCVPLFFMISGFLLLQKDESLADFFSKRLSKLFIPIVFWSIFFVFWGNVIEKSRTPLLEDFKSLILQPSYYHLWFLYALVGLYLFVPILRKVTHNSDNTLLIYYIYIWIIAVSIIPFIEKITGIESRIDLNSISGFIGYFILGLILGRKQISAKVFYSCVIIYALSIVMTVTGTYVLTLQNNGIFVGYFYNYFSLNVIVGAGACFIVIKYLFLNNNLTQKPLLTKFITTISSCSFGIYLVHPVFLFVLKDGTFGFKLSPFTGNAFMYVPFTAIAVFTLSLLLIFIVKKIPLVRQIAP